MQGIRLWFDDLQMMACSLLDDVQNLLGECYLLDFYIMRTKCLFVLLQMKQGEVRVR